MNEAVEDIDANHLRDSERWIVRNGVGVQIMETLAVGAFLTALAVTLGAPNWMIGALAAIPHIAQIAQLPALWTVERLRKRRAIYLVSGMIARPMLLVIALAAVLFSGMQALWIILGAFAIRYAAGAFLSCSWNSWMRDLVPDAAMGRLFSNRQQKMIGVGILFSLLAAAFIDLWKNYSGLPTEYAYATVYTLAFIGGTYSVICARKIFEPPMETSHVHILSQLRAPFANENYRRLITFLASWNFAVNLAAPFFTVYMLKRLEYELTLVIAFATISQIASFLTVRYWGSIADHFTNKVVLATCCPLFILSVFAWTFTTLPEPHSLTIPLLVVIHITTGFAVAGVNLASGNIALKLAPLGGSTAYLASSSMINATAAGIAALMGGIAVDLFATWELGLTIHWQSEANTMQLEAMNFSHWDFFFLFSTVVGLYALHRLSLVEEKGQVQEPQMLHVLMGSAKQSMRNLSTIAGLRASSEFPIDALLAKKIKPEKNSPTEKT
jgi:MFS family permease